MSRARHGAALLAVAMLGWTAGAAAEIYRWVDANGQVHFGQRPGSGAERVEVRPQVIERDDATRAREQAAERFFEARREERAVAAGQNRERREQRLAHCAALRRELAHIEQPGSFYTTDAAGERSYYSDAQMAAARQRLRSQIEQSCEE